MKIMGWWSRFKYGLFYESQPEQVIHRVRQMDHHELTVLHRSYGTHTTQDGTPADIQRRAIAKELIRRGDPLGTHTPLPMSQFVKLRKTGAFS
jgi:hypothetical protein